MASPIGMQIVGRPNGKVEMFRSPHCLKSWLLVKKTRSNSVDSVQNWILRERSSNLNHIGEFHRTPSIQPPEYRFGHQRLLNKHSIL